MADARISELPAATEPLNDADLVEVVQGGVNKKAPKSAFGGGGAVASVNGQTGVVVLDAGDVGADPAGSAAAAAAASQPVDPDLTAMAALSPSNDDVLQRKAGAWTNRTPAQLQADLISRVQSVVSAATVTPNANTDDMVKITAQAAALALANPSGTPTEGQGMVIRIKDNGTARAISYDTQYRQIGVVMPLITVISKTTYIAMIYNATDSMWDVIFTKTQV